MDILGGMAQWLKPLVPGWSPEQVGRLADGLGETVLWTGSGYGGGAVEDWLRHAVLSFLISAAFLALAGWLAYRASRQGGKRRVISVIASVAGIVLCALMALTGKLFLDGARDASGAYVMTSSRLLVLTGGDAREEILASDVVGIRPGGDGVRIDLPKGRTLLVRAGLADLPDLVKAARTFGDGGKVRI